MSEMGSRQIQLRRIALWLVIGLLLLSSASSRSADAVASADRFATLIELNGPIGPAMSRYVEHSMADAGNQGSAVVILQMDTPGGLDTSMRDIIKAILASPLPVVVYVRGQRVRGRTSSTRATSPRWLPRPTWVLRRRFR
jgi:membrane-bound serine protease (ClpP class)